MCDRWLGDGGFDRFYADVGPRPCKGYSLDRINNDGDYEPGNVRWVTNMQQSRNQRTNRHIEFQGETKTLQDWANQIGATKNALWARLEVHKWTVEDALTVPFIKYNTGVTFRSRTMPMAAWAKETGLPRETIRSRLRLGWTAERALTTPHSECRSRDSKGRWS